MTSPEEATVPAPNPTNDQLRTVICRELSKSAWDHTETDVEDSLVRAVESHVAARVDAATRDWRDEGERLADLAELATSHAEQWKARALKAEAELAARPALPDEWEWGVHRPKVEEWMPAVSEQSARDFIASGHPGLMERLVRRRPGIAPGPWEAVEEAATTPTDDGQLTPGARRVLEALDAHLASASEKEPRRG